MKKTIISLSIAAIAAMGSAPTFAGEKLFDGPYVGIEAGFNKVGQGNGNNFDKSSYITAADKKILGYDAGTSGLSYAGFIGWRTQSNSGIVLGVEASLGNSTSDVTETGPYFGDNYSSNGGIKTSYGRQVGIDVTIGKTLSDNVLIFATIGQTFTKVKTQSYSVVDKKAVWTKEKDDNYYSNESYDGTKLGLGAEFALSESVSVRGILSYINYENDQSDVQFLVGALFNF